MTGTGDPMPTIPQYIQDHLDQPPSYKGGRHEDMLRLDAKMAGESVPESDRFAILRKRYPDKDKSDQEIWDIIKGARARNFKPADTSSRPTGHYRRESSKLEIVENKVYFTLSDKPEATEIPPGQQLLPIEFLRKAFNPGELVCINNETAERAGKETIIGHGFFQTLEKWGEWFEEMGQTCLNGTAGCWIRINPFKAEANEGDDKNVADFRNLLVEFDTRPKLEQWRIYKESGLPIRFVIDSGGDSLHAWISVNAKTAEEFKARQERVYEFLEAYLDDKGNKNPSRYSRLPGVERREKGNYQTLVAENIGAASWSEWEDWNISDGLPEPMAGDDFLKVEYEASPEVINGVLRKGSKLILGAPSKSRKTWNLIALALCVNSGKPWLGFETALGKVLYINFELRPDKMQERVRYVSKSLGVGSINNVTFWNIRGHATDIEHVVNRTLARFRKQKFDLIILDPIYKCLGWRDENKAGDITDLLNHIERLTEGTQAATAIVAHFAKGDAHEKAAADRVSGSGVFLRDPDASINMTPVLKKERDDPTHFEVDLNLREFPSVEAFDVKWDSPFFRRLTDEEIKVIKETKESRDAKYLIELATLLTEEGASVKAWHERAQIKARYKSGEKSFYRMIGKIESAGLVKVKKGEKNSNIYTPDAEAIQSAEAELGVTFSVEGEEPF